MTASNTKITHHMIEKQRFETDAVSDLPITGLRCIPHNRFEDNRGYYAELAKIPDLGSDNFCAKQVNIAHSKENVIRGIHTEDWNKLVTVTRGLAYCVLVDLRPHSNSFLRCVHIKLGPHDEGCNASLFVPKGVGNSVCALSGPIDYIYVVDELYRDREKSQDIAISVFDPMLDIKWPINQKNAIISQRDKAGIALQEKFPSLL